MKIKTLEVAGIHSALRAMRNPLDSWDKSDSVTGKVGRKDMELSRKLALAGTEHSKHLRMIQVWADIEAPLYWWKQFDTYRVGVEKLSTSTMHTLCKRPMNRACFEHDSMNFNLLDSLIEILDRGIMNYNACEDDKRRKEMWRGIIQALPESYIQKRTVMISYAALRNIRQQRKGHKLNEWQTFIAWMDTLPERWMITDILPEKNEVEEDYDE